MKTIDITAKNNRGEKFEVTILVKDGTQELFSRVVEARSKRELDNTLANVLSVANQVEADFALIEEGVWTPPIVETPVVAEPTTAEIEAQAISTKEMELQEMVEKVKKEKEFQAIALENADVKAKLDELNAFKA